MIEIQKNIPLISISKRMNKYPFSIMDVGDSFLFPLNEGPGHTERAAVSYASKANEPKKFTTRTTREGIRCWRIV